MNTKDIEIEISKTGDVKVHMKGIKGKSCLDLAKLFENAVGKVKSQELTAEYYEPESNVGIDVSQR